MEAEGSEEFRDPSSVASSWGSLPEPGALARGLGNLSLGHLLELRVSEKISPDACCSVPQCWP